MTQVHNKAKLIVISRRDLSSAVQSVQSGHALAKFCIENPVIANSWHQNSQYLVYLSVEDEASLHSLIAKLQSRGIVMSDFQEPDLDNQITAIAIEPTKKAHRLCSNLPLAFRELPKQKLEKEDVLSVLMDNSWLKTITYDCRPDEFERIIEEEEFELCAEEIIEFINN